MQRGLFKFKACILSRSRNQLAIEPACKERILLGPILTPLQFKFQSLAGILLPLEQPLCQAPHALLTLIFHRHQSSNGKSDLRAENKTKPRAKATANPNGSFSVRSNLTLLAPWQDPDQLRELGKHRPSNLHLMETSDKLNYYISFKAF